MWADVDAHAAQDAFTVLHSLTQDHRLDLKAHRTRSRTGVATDARGGAGAQLDSRKAEDVAKALPIIMNGAIQQAW